MKLNKSALKIKKKPFFNKLNLNMNQSVIMYSGTLNEKLSYETLINSIYS